MQNKMQDKILQQREQRASLQQALLDEYGHTLIVVKVNYPGANKHNHLSAYVSCKYFLKVKDMFELVYYEASLTLEGLIFYVFVKEDARLVKQQTIQLESSELGRLLDIDVYTKEEQLSRKDFAFEQRLCFICQQPALFCIRKQEHDYNEIRQYFETIVLNDIFNKEECYANMAVYGLINELCKPLALGTVSLSDVGSHDDMDYKAFLLSIEAIYKQMFSFNKIDSTDFETLRIFGLRIEKAMFQATNNINTHKGAIFSLLALFSALKNHQQLNNLSEYLKVLFQDIFKDFEDMKTTNGIRLYRENQITGIRGLAYTGYELLFEKIYSFYQRYEHDDSKVFIYIVSLLEDTTIINRSNYKTLKEIQNLASQALEDESQQSKLINLFKEKKLSSGGSADLFAMLLIYDLVVEHENIFTKNR